MSKITTYKDLIVWQKSMELVISVYKLTEKFPSTETYGLSLQMRRSAVSIPSNVAEGRRWTSNKDFVKYLKISYGSCLELETQLEIAKRLSYGKVDDFLLPSALLIEVMKMLNKMISSLK